MSRWYTNAVLTVLVLCLLGILHYARQTTRRTTDLDARIAAWIENQNKVVIPVELSGVSSGMDEVPVKTQYGTSLNVKTPIGKTLAVEVENEPVEVEIRR